jgi:hypothetical protein
MNLKWDEDADVFHKTEGLKPIAAEDIEIFNKAYDHELNTKVQKEKDAADKLEKMQKKAAEAGKTENVPKGPTVLQRGAFKRGEKIEKAKDQEEKEGDKDGAAAGKDGTKKEDGDQAAKGQPGDRPDGQQRKNNKKEKDQKDTPKTNGEEGSKPTQGGQQQKDGRKQQNKNQQQGNSQNPQNGLQSRPQTRQPISQRDDAAKDQDQPQDEGKDKDQKVDGNDQKGANQRKKKAKTPAQPKQMQKQPSFMRNQDEEMDFATQGMQWAMMNNMNNFQEHQPYPPGLYMMPQNSHINPLYPAYMSEDIQPMSQSQYQHQHPHMNHMNHPMMQMPYYGNMGQNHDNFNNGMDQNLLEEQYIKQMLNLNTNMQPQPRMQPKQPRGNPNK